MMLSDIIMKMQHFQKTRGSLPEGWESPTEWGKLCVFTYCPPVVTQLLIHLKNHYQKKTHRQKICYPEIVYA
jgi:hypothetical protein